MNTKTLKMNTEMKKNRAVPFFHQTEPKIGKKKGENIEIFSQNSRANNKSNSNNLVIWENFSKWRDVINGKTEKETLIRKDDLCTILLRQGIICY